MNLGLCLIGVGCFWDTFGEVNVGTNIKLILSCGDTSASSLTSPICSGPGSKELTPVTSPPYLSDIYAWSISIFLLIIKYLLLCMPHSPCIVKPHLSFLRWVYF